MVNVDSIVVVGMLKKSMICNARHEAIVKRCKGLLESLDWAMVVSHCYREANQVTDALANIGVDLNCHFVFLMSFLGRSLLHCM